MATTHLMRVRVAITFMEAVAEWQCSGLWSRHMRVRIPSVTLRGRRCSLFWQNRISRSRLERHQPSLIRCECKFESCLRYYRTAARQKGAIVNNDSRRCPEINENVQGNRTHRHYIADRRKHFVALTAIRFKWQKQIRDYL